MKTCGTCTLCCELLPVQSIGLKSFTRCQYQRPIFHKDGAGCSIYSHRPAACRTWSCGWLVSPDVPDEYRPDRVGFVIDVMKDLVQINGEDADAAQIWVQRGHEEDWRDGKARQVIDSLLMQSRVVLWRVPPGTHARAFAVDEDGVNVCYTELQAHTDENDKRLGGQIERLQRLNALTNRRK